MPETPAPRAAGRTWQVVRLLLALLLLDAMLTFHNVWPTPFVHWPGELSIDLACVLLLLVAWHRVAGTLPARLLSVLAVVFVLGTLGRYSEVTAPALYGREINLYWDLRHTASLAGMLARAVSPWLLLACAAGILATLALLYYASLWSLRGVAQSLASPPLNAALGAVAGLMICWFALQRIDERVPRMPQFSIPVTKTYATQFVKVAQAMTGTGAVRELPPSPVLDSTLSLVQGRDIVVMFVESYGRTVYERPELAQALSDERTALELAVHETGRGMVSGFVESPTFGGGSWLAHLSFLSGVEVRDAARAQLLMTQSRRTFGSELARHGYRRVALMPGLKSRWPEGAFYDFDELYDDARLGYRGPAFGWWRIPDQYSLAQLDALELVPREHDRNARAPVFAFFPTVSTHAPFRPTPPYQPDWSRMLSTTPYDAPIAQEALRERPEWNNMDESYLGAVEYSLRTLAGYLREHEHRDFVLIVLGDHQPPAFVSGQHASWDVPVHVIASEPALLRALQKRGFVPGATPAAATLGPMHRLGPTLLEAFEAPPFEASGPALSHVTDDTPVADQAPVTDEDAPGDATSPATGRSGA